MRTHRRLRLPISFVLSVLFVPLVLSACSRAPLSPIALTPTHVRDLENSQGDQYSDVLSRQKFQFWHDAGWLPVASFSAAAPTTQSSVLNPQSFSSLRSARIAWNPNSDPDLKRYLVCRSDNLSTSSIQVADLVTTPTISCTVEDANYDAPVIANGKICGFLDAKLDPARIYYYAVYAVDISGNVSLPALFDPDGARLRVRFMPLAAPTGVRVFALPWK